MFGSIEFHVCYVLILCLVVLSFMFAMF
jgi:hypothetical protein